jgi:hypothetical protein
MRVVGVVALLATAALAATPLRDVVVDAVRSPATSDAEREPRAGGHAGVAPLLRNEEIAKHREKIRRASAMSPSQIAQAERIVAGDEQLAKLLDGRPYEIVRMGPWTLSGGDGHIGALIDLELDEPLASERTVTLPSIHYEEGGRSYTEHPFRVKILHADELTVLARFTEGRLVSVEPGVGSRLRHVEGNRRFPPGDH